MFNQNSLFNNVPLNSPNNNCNNLNCLDNLNDFDDSEDFKKLTKKQKQSIMECKQKMKEIRDKIKDNIMIKKEKLNQAKKNLVCIEVKPLDENIDLEELWNLIIQIKKEGLEWKNTFKLEPVCGTNYKLIVTCVIDDDLVSCDDIKNKIKEFENCVQSVDILSIDNVHL